MQAFRHTLKNKEGSSLLITLIVMGILLTLSLGVSDLMMGTMKDTRLLLEKTKAWYAAESGIEISLLKIADNAPGYEDSGEENFDPAEAGTKFSYQIHAAASVIPEKEAYEIKTDADRFADLQLSSSVVIPLFRGANPEDTVKKLRVEYYLAPNLNIAGGHVDEDLDILRWKIFGIASDGKMEVINEFLPLMQGNSASSPTCFGTGTNCWNASKFYKRLPISEGVSEYQIIDRFPIETFLNEHKQNFLVLTNMMNIDMIAGVLSNRDKERVAQIRYRIIDEENKKQLTLPETLITSDGFAGNTKQSINLKLQRESFLPVFNYALYRIY
jgi:hypothetical protein